MTARENVAVEELEEPRRFLHRDRGTVTREVVRR